MCLRVLPLICGRVCDELFLPGLVIATDTSRQGDFCSFADRTLGRGAGTQGHRVHVRDREIAGRTEPYRVLAACANTSRRAAGGRSLSHARECRADATSSWSRQVIRALSRTHRERLDPALSGGPRRQGVYVRCTPHRRLHRGAAVRQLRGSDTPAGLGSGEGVVDNSPLILWAGG